MNKDLVVGLGEIGTPILQVISKAIPAAGYDIEQKLVDRRKFDSLSTHTTIFAHICIPFTERFVDSVLQIYQQHKPKTIVIHNHWPRNNRDYSKKNSTSQ